MENTKDGLKWVSDYVKYLIPTNTNRYCIEKRPDSIFYYKDNSIVFEYIPKYNYLFYDKFITYKLRTDYGFFTIGRYENNKSLNTFFRNFIGDQNIKYFSIQMYSYKTIEDFINGKSEQFRL